MSVDDERFNVAMAWLLPTEGGWWPGGPSDPNPTYRGVTQKVYDAFRGDHPQSVRLMTEAEMDAIYRHNYWMAAGCPYVGWPLGLCLFDTAVNCGVANSRKLLAQTDDPAQYIRLRGAYYRKLAADKPDLAPNLPGWLNRNTHLAMSCEVTL